LILLIASPYQCIYKKPKPVAGSLEKYKNSKLQSKEKDALADAFAEK